jgi:CheY-like chemotaxis protein
MDAIGQLAGGVAHDFNNLLTVINGHIGLLQMKGQASPALTNSIQQIAEAANRAGNLTRQLLTFSRQEVMEPADHNLNSLVANLLKMLRRLLGEHIELEVDYAPMSLPIRADEGMVEQVLLNLVVNARDAMAKGGTLRIATAPVDLTESDVQGQPQLRPGRFACLMVSDTGHGIAPEILPRIFEPFFTTKEAGKGTGLGLATVYGVMQQHEGWVTVESTPGCGTTFRAYFPRLHSAVIEAAAVQSLGIRGGHETILFVEDEEAVRILGEAALVGLGYRVLCAASGMEALQIWQAHRHEIDLLVTDLVMPGGINGRELAERLQPDQPRMPVIYMSGYSLEVAGKDLTLVEGRNYMAKPFDVAKLAKTVRSNLDRSGSRKPFNGHP